MHFIDSEGSGQVLLSSSATPAHPVGTRRNTPDGRSFRYSLAGAAALVAGNVIQAPAQLVNHQQLTPAAAAIAADTITVTLGATLATANQYAGGWAIIDTTPGLGYSYPISGHPAADASATLAVTLVPGSFIQVALTTDSRVSLQSNAYRNVIQAPVTTLTGAVVGVCPFPLTLAQYGWIQTHGPCGTLIVGTPAVGHIVGPPTTSAGAAAINTSTNPVLGHMMVTGVDGKVQAVFLTID